MIENKTIFTCKNCQNKFGFPHTENLIKIKCPFCSEIYYGKLGKIQNKNEGDWTDPIAVVDEKNDGDKKTQESNSNGKNGIKDEKPNLQKNQESNNKRVFERQNFWIFSTFILIAVVLILALVIFTTGKEYIKAVNEHQKSEIFTNKVIYELRNSKNGDFSGLKKYMSDQTKKRFEMFIESQYILKDSASLNSIVKVLNTTNPLGYYERRKFYYLDEKNDSAFFFVNYIPNGDSFLLDVSMDEFLK